MSLPAAILAGGLATRLRPITEKIPKSLVDVNGEPFIAHQLRLLYSKGIVRVVICAGYLGEMIQDFVGNGRRFDIQVEYSFDDVRLLGTGGAVKKALALLDESFFVLYGDSYLPCDYEEVQAAFEGSEKKALMTVFHNEGAWDTSNVEFKDGQILSYEKQRLTPRMRHIDYGLGVFQREAFATVPEDTPYDLADLYQFLLEKGELAAFEVMERFYEIGSIAGLEELKSHLARSS
ncbi:MAG: nucleotidyltransferase family protein [Proteobacteria bacterium]|nr:nucleotidyltransferase family protein [Pseudomonadota bacterium]